MNNNVLITRYDDKRWVPRNGPSKSPSNAQEERTAESPQRHFDNKLSSREEQHNSAQLNAKKTTPATPKLPSQVKLSELLFELWKLYVQVFYYIWDLLLQVQYVFDRLISVCLILIHV